MLHLFQTLIINKEDAEILIELEPSWNKFRRPDGTILVRLLKALYGCIESARLWYQLAKDVLLSEGFSMNPYDPCVFNKRINGLQCTIAIYVDDFLLTCQSDSILEAVIKTLKNRFQDLTVSAGNKISYIGMTFDFSKSSAVEISMTHFINELLMEFKDLREHKSPAKDSIFHISPESPALPESQRIIFHSLVAKFLYLSKGIRPDLLLATSFLSTRVTKATSEDYQKLRRLAGYLLKTRSLTLILSPPKDRQISVSTYIDASYGIHPDGKSHTGLSITLGGGCILAKSTKQKIVTKSSTEAELVGLSTHAGVGIELGKMIFHQLVPSSKDLDESLPVTLLQDNKSTIALIRNGRPTHDSTRHILIRHFWLSERIQRKEVNLVYCPTEIMVADILTKALQGEILLRLRNAILNGTPEGAPESEDTNG
jgi:hypothetical protein